MGMHARFFNILKNKQKTIVAAPEDIFGCVTVGKQDKHGYVGYKRKSLYHV